MADDLHITRADDWKSTDGSEITENEWRDCIEGDSDLVPDPANGPNAAIWTGHPDGVLAWLDWADGNIYTSDPDDALRAKMVEIAAALEGTLVDDENQLV